MFHDPDFAPKGCAHMKMPLGAKSRSRLLLTQNKEFK